MLRLTKTIAALAAVLTLAACGGKGGGGGGGADSSDVFLGKADAPITVIEYASVACPHCADFNNKDLPAFKAKYIDTGVVKYVPREALTGDPAFATAGFLVARCAGKDKYFAVTDALYRRQMDIYQSGDIRGGLEQIAAEVGMTPDQFNKCINDEAGLKALNDRIKGYEKEHTITGTPAFFVDGKEVAQATLPELEKAVEAAKVAKGIK